MHPYFHLFSFQLPAYGFMLMIAILGAFVLMNFLRRYNTITEDDYYSAIIWLLLSGLFGSKLLYWIVEMDEIISNPRFLLVSLTSGFVYYGAFIGAVIGIFIFTKRKKQKFFSYMDLFCPAIALGQAFGRIGCFLAGCCYGAPSTCSIAVIYPRIAGSSAPAGIPLLPTQLFESAFCFILAAVLTFIYLKEKHLASTTGFYCIFYGLWRFFIEFYRFDDRGSVGILSTSQFISIFIVLLGLILLYYVKKGKFPIIERPNKETDNSIDNSSDLNLTMELDPDESDSVSLQKPENNPNKESDFNESSDN